ncbi:hypothetical protein H5410_022647 [Solanum commersonii]|uniref:Uncharacterized protein n=1 Tax=Solanum commersonii TaxID=4109 RepID=A0A9J5ZJK0_SOLCO|nr:hypothetical protein H5410_022647 [Solanum commersonii]
MECTSWADELQQTTSNSAADMNVCETAEDLATSFGDVNEIIFIMQPPRVSHKLSCLQQNPTSSRRHYF